MLRKLLFIGFALLLAIPLKAAQLKNIPLSVGIIHDEVLPDMPEHFKITGTYRPYVRLEYNGITKTLRLIPKRAGFGTLEILDRNTRRPVYKFTVDVRQTDLKKVAREIKGLLSQIEGITVTVINNKVIVDGQILLPADMERIHDVVKQYGGLAASLVRLSPEAQVKIAQFIERAINDPEIHVKAVNGKYLLEGVAQDQKEKDRAEILAKTYVPDVIVDEAVADKKVQQRVSQVVINLITVKPPPTPEPAKTIQIVVHYVELQKDYTKGFRFQWTPSIGDGSAINFTTGQNSPSGLGTVISGTITNLIPKLNWAKEHGHARVLQSTSIIVEDGHPGTLNSTENVPYQTAAPVGTGFMPTTSFVPVGINTTVTPSVIGAESDSVNLNLKFSISDLVSNTPAGPMTDQNEVDTVVVVRSGQSAAIGGLITSHSDTAYNREPADASTNPILSLYASKDFNKNQSQFVVFVTPIIKTSASAGANRIKRKFRLRE